MDMTDRRNGSTFDRDEPKDKNEILRREAYISCTWEKACKGKGRPGITPGYGLTALNLPTPPVTIDS